MFIGISLKVQIYDSIQFTSDLFKHSSQKMPFGIPFITVQDTRVCKLHADCVVRIVDTCFTEAFFPVERRATATFSFWLALALTILVMRPSCPASHVFLCSTVMEIDLPSSLASLGSGVQRTCRRQPCLRCISLPFDVASTARCCRTGCRYRRTVSCSSCSTSCTDCTIHQLRRLYH